MSHAVLVIDMAHTGAEDDGRVVDGFATFAAARAYAEARTRASVEELRTAGQSPAELRTLWHVYGEDCVVMGGGFSGRDALDDYIARPASPAEWDWASLAPKQPPAPERRFYATLLHSNAAQRSAWAGGFFSRREKPTRDELFALFRGDAAAAFARRGDADAVPLSLHVANLFELPQTPLPPDGDTRPLANWRVAVAFVCHDIKFGHQASGVFEWPEQPAGTVLDTMGRVLVAESLAMRGDGPDWLEFCEVLSLRVEQTADAPDHAPD